MTQHWTERALSAEDAVAHVLSGMPVFIHGAAATPARLIDALAKRDVENVTTYHLHLHGEDGIGAIPDAVLARLFDKRDLGVHTAMFSDRVIDLGEPGVITNRRKKVHPGRITTSFVNGSSIGFRMYSGDAPRRRDHARSRALDRDRVRRGGSLGQVATRARGGADLHRPFRFPRGTAEGAGGFS